MMKSAILTSDGFELKQVAIPEINDDEVLVEVTHCGVCSGDLHLYQNKDHLPQTRMALGHEVIGVVKAIGASVENFQPGDPVTAVDGVGGYSEQFVAPQSFLSKISPAVTEQMQMGEPIACCVHAVNRLTLSTDMRVAVVGCGFMGLVCQKIIQHRGCLDVTAFDLQDYRRDMAIQIGASQAHDPRNFPITDPDQGDFDVVVEAAGVGNALAFCTDIIAHHGQMLIVGYHQGNQGQRNVNMQRWNYKAIDVFNGHVRHMDEKYVAMVEGLEACGEDKLNILPLLTSYSLDDIETAFRDLSDPSKQLFKAVIEMK